jgi:hypothetical protein
MTTTQNEKQISFIQSYPARSAWAKGVKEYALELVESLEGEYSQVKLLNGAENWNAYSYGGCASIYDADIAERLCSPSELKRCKGGDLQPSSRESWLDCQARALGQAARLVNKAFNA